MLGPGALGQPRGIVWGARREQGSGWGTHAYLWQIHFDIWQDQYNIKLNTIKFKKKKKDNLEEMNKLLEKHNLPKLNQEEIDNLKIPIPSMEIKTVIKNVPSNKNNGVFTLMVTLDTWREQEREHRMAFVWGRG